MSLVEHVNHGMLRAWFDTHAPGLPALAARLLEQIPAETIRPQRRVPLEHYAQVGGIVGQRLADAVEPAPPYAALLGAVRCSALSLDLAGEYAARYPTHSSVLTRRRAALIRPVPGGGFWHTQPGAAAGPGGNEDDTIAGLLESARLVTSRPGHGRIADEHVERDAVAYYYLLNLLETVHRAGRIPAELHHIADTGEIVVDDTVLDDVLEVLHAQHDTLEQAKDLCGARRRWGFASPLFVPGWAEGDILLGPRDAGSYTLLDVKTVTYVDEDRLLGWLRQLVAYALLDLDRQRWHIADVGLWLPRQRTILTVRLEEILDGLTGAEPVPSFWDTATTAMRTDSVPESSIHSIRGHTPGAWLTGT